MILEEDGRQHFRRCEDRPKRASSFRAAAPYDARHAAQSSCRATSRAFATRSSCHCGFARTKSSVAFAVETSTVTCVRPSSSPGVYHCSAPPGSINGPAQKTTTAPNNQRWFRFREYDPVVEPGRSKRNWYVLNLPWFTNSPARADRPGSRRGVGSGRGDAAAASRIVRDGAATSPRRRRDGAATQNGPRGRRASNGLAAVALVDFQVVPLDELVVAHVLRLAADDARAATRRPDVETVAVVRRQRRRL